MHLLLGSGGFSKDEPLKEAWFSVVARHLADVERVLFIPHALADHDSYVEWMQDWHAGREVVGLHRADDPKRAIAEAEAISVGGGNTFRLTKALHELGLLDPIRERVRDGVPYMGVSAGSNVAGPSLRTTNDMPIVDPPSFETLGLVPFQINPHYFEGATWVELDGALRRHGGETRDDRLAEFHEENSAPVLALWEGAWLSVSEQAVDLGGAAARLFRPGLAPLDLLPGASLAGLL